MVPLSRLVLVWVVEDSFGLSKPTQDSFNTDLCLLQQVFTQLTCAGRNI